MRLWLGNFLLLLFLYPGFKAQNSDCVTAAVICFGSVIFTPANSGRNDFASPSDNSNYPPNENHLPPWYYLSLQPVIIFSIKKRDVLIPNVFSPISAEKRFPTVFKFFPKHEQTTIG